MKKGFIAVISSLMMTAFISSCSDTKQVKADPPQNENVQVKASVFSIEPVNAQIKDFSVDGFPGGSSKLKKNKDLENMKKIVEIVKPVIDTIPDGYVMQITGHCANYDSKATKQRVSTARAKKVYEELKAAGVSADKMIYKGVSADEPDEKYGAKDFRQRKVSFKVVQK